MSERTNSLAARRRVADEARAATTKPIDDENDTIIVVVKLKSGRFESSIEVPLLCSEKERQRFVESWLMMMRAGLKCTGGRP